MKLLLQRDPEMPEYIEGQLYLSEGDRFGYTLENPLTRPEGDDRPLGIPEGDYPVTIRWSLGFDKFMPHIEDVPGRSGIELHGGNRPSDSHGCVLVGKNRLGPGLIGNKETDVLIAYLQNTAEHVTGEGNDTVWSGHSISIKGATT